MQLKSHSFSEERVLFGLTVVVAEVWSLICVQGSYFMVTGCYRDVLLNIGLVFMGLEFQIVT